MLFLILMAIILLDKVINIDEDLNMPDGVALKDRNLYVAEVSRIL